MPSQNKTKTLKLSQWQGHEYVSFDDISEDNRKIDTAIEQVNTSLSNKIDRSEVQGMIGNVDLSGKVDKVAGKGLSTNDYTTAEKNKVANLPTNTNSDLNTIRSSISNLSSNVATANAGLNNKVDKVTGKGLSTNDYTTNDRNKVNNLPANTISEINNLKQSVVSGKQTIATAINDLVGSTVASSSMTHGDLAVSIRNNLTTIKRVYYNGSSSLSDFNLDARMYFNNGATPDNSYVNYFFARNINNIKIGGSFQYQTYVFIPSLINFSKFSMMIIKLVSPKQTNGGATFGIVSSIPTKNGNSTILQQRPTPVVSSHLMNNDTVISIALNYNGYGYIYLYADSSEGASRDIYVSEITLIGK